MDKPASKSIVGTPGTTVYVPKNHPSGLGGQSIYLPLNTINPVGCVNSRDCYEVPCKQS